MKAKSGILLAGDGGLNKSDGFVVIPFNPFPKDGFKPRDDLPQLELRLAREVGGSGGFDGKPAYMASIHEYTLEDSRRGAGRREMDSVVLDPIATEDELRLKWELSDTRARAIEIGFLVVGE